jgi:protein AaeX
MSFVEINVFGVLISPIVPLIVVAFAITMVLRWAAVEFGWVRRIWHPALFEFSIFLIVLTATVLTFGTLRIYN